MCACATVTGLWKFISVITYVRSRVTTYIVMLIEFESKGQASLKAVFVWVGLVWAGLAMTNHDLNSQLIC